MSRSVVAFKLFFHILFLDFFVSAKLETVSKKLNKKVRDDNL